MSKIKIKHPTVINDFGLVTLSGITYVCPGWYEVPTGTHREDVEFISDIIIDQNRLALESSRVNRKVEHIVPSSNGKKTYKVQLMNGIWSCTCPAANFRRGDCKHIKRIKAETK